MRDRIRSDWHLFVLVGTSLFAYLIGVTAPIVRVDKSFLGLFSESEGYALFDVIRDLLGGDMPILGFALFAFTVVFPALKYLALTTALVLPRRSPTPRWYSLVHSAGKWSMVDVFVVAVTIVVVKVDSGMAGVHMTVLPGLVFFMFSFFSTLIGSAAISQRFSAPRRCEAHGRGILGPPCGGIDRVNAGPILRWAPVE